MQQNYSLYICKGAFETATKQQIRAKDFDKVIAQLQHDPTESGSKDITRLQGALKGNFRYTIKKKVRLMHRIDEASKTVSILRVGARENFYKG